MYVTPEQIQSANKANVEALLAVANAQFAAFVKATGYVTQAERDEIRRLLDTTAPTGKGPNDD